MTIFDGLEASGPVCPSVVSRLATWIERVLMLHRPSSSPSLSVAV
jgi:hypothetical protein